MTPLRIFGVYFRPRWCDEHALVIAVRLSQSGQRRFACYVLKRCSSVNQSPIEEHPTTQPAGGNAVGEGSLNGATREGHRVDPRKRRALALKFVLDDPSTRLIHNRIAAPGKLDNQRR